MAEGGGQPFDQGIDDYLYSEELYVDRLPENFSCPVCLCPVQRAAHLTQCCGNHFCLVCIDRIRRDGKPCPMCNGHPVVTFPNKERQREVNQLKVLCPLRGEDGVDGGCDWTGELGQMYSHVFENHRNENAEEITEEVDAKLAETFEHCQIEDSRLPAKQVINRSTASFPLEIPSDVPQGGTNLTSNQVSSSHCGTPDHPAGGGVTLLVTSSSPGPISLVTVVQGHQTTQVVPLAPKSSGQPSGQSEVNFRQHHQSLNRVHNLPRPRLRQPPVLTSRCHHQSPCVASKSSGHPLGNGEIYQGWCQRRQSPNKVYGHMSKPAMSTSHCYHRTPQVMTHPVVLKSSRHSGKSEVNQGQCKHHQSPKKVCARLSIAKPPMSASHCHHKTPQVMPLASKPSGLRLPSGQSVVNQGQSQRHQTPRKLCARLSKPPMSTSQVLPPILKSLGHPSGHSVVNQGQSQRHQSPKKVCACRCKPIQPPMPTSNCHHQTPQVIPLTLKSSGQSSGKSVGQGQRR